MLIVPKPQLATAKGIVGERKIETETFQKHYFTDIYSSDWVWYHVVQKILDVYWTFEFTVKL